MCLLGYLIGDCLFIFASYSFYIIVPRSLIFLIDPTSYIFQSTISIGTNDCYLCIYVMKFNRPKKLLSRGFLKYILIQNIKTVRDFNIINVESRNQLISDLKMNNRLIYKHE